MIRSESTSRRGLAPGARGEKGQRRLGQQQPVQTKRRERKRKSLSLRIHSSNKENNGIGGEILEPIEELIKIEPGL